VNTNISPGGVTLVIGLALALGSGRAEAETKHVKCTTTGTFVDIPIDLDSDSCFAAANGATVCTDYSSYSNYSFFCSPGGRQTGQVIAEYDPVAGSGCNIGGNVVPGIASCTLADSSEQGCAFQNVGGAEVDRDDSTGDLTFLAYSSETVCIDLSSGPPFNFTANFDQTITGGTGKNAGATGTLSGTYHGQTLTSDAALHGFGWFEVKWTETITTP
jgi:hypothetical protein